MGAEELKAAVFAAEDVLHEDVTIPEWNGVTLRVQGMGHDAQEGFWNDHVRGHEGEEGQVGMATAILIRTLCDPASGDLVFAEADRQALGKKHPDVILRLAKVAFRVCGMDVDDLEDRAKNSDETPESDSG
ncbi:MAG: hypothetical protein KAV00_02080 [Phycisphaerae bacterium]|nr:hypothetical protein [Phycisphaerae bacterium]